MVGERMETWKFRDERPEDEEIRRYGSAGASTGATGAADLGFQDHQVVIEDMVGAIATTASRSSRCLPCCRRSSGRWRCISRRNRAPR